MFLFTCIKVTCVGQTIGAIVATDRRTATIASYKVRVEYKDIKPAIITVEVKMCKISIMCIQHINPSQYSDVRNNIFMKQTISSNPL